MKFRLSRLDRIYTEGLFYFLTFGTHERRRILACAELHEAFRGFASAAPARNVYVGLYVIMPDHFHLFAAFGDETPLSSWMKSLKNFLSKALRGLGVDSPHWQKGYFDHLIRSDESYDSKWEYVFQNPVRHELVAEASLWPFQSEINSLVF
jgi:REP element-mobilizing transposase RayT